MDVRKCVEKRKSIRAFQKTPIPKEILEEILGTALRSPSWGNTQPSKITVVGGEVLQAMIRDFLQKVSSGEPSRTDLPFPKDWPEEQGRFYRENGKRLFAFLNIGRDDKDRRNAHFLNMFRFCGAPHAIYIHMDKKLGSYSIFDAGLLAENIALLATEKGLGTCFLAVSVNYLDIVRLHTGIPESDLILIGMAIGYPDERALINKFYSERQPLESVVRWVG
jgi:nitroreductase